MASYTFRGLPPNTAVSVYTSAAVATRDAGTTTTGYGAAQTTSTTDNNGSVTVTLALGDWIAVANDGRYEHRAGGQAVSTSGATAGDTAESETAASGAYQPLVRATTVAYAATVTPNADTTDVLNIGALTGNLTLAAPTGTPRDGQTLMLRLAQDATGSRTITYNAAYAFGTDVTAALDPSTASAKWTRLFAWNASDSKWRALAIARGF